jgi:hypothetical protein
MDYDQWNEFLDHTVYKCIHINRKYENTRPTLRLIKRWIGKILEVLINVTVGEANKRAKDRATCLRRQC